MHDFKIGDLIRANRQTLAKTNYSESAQADYEINGTAIVKGFDKAGNLIITWINYPYATKNEFIFPSKYFELDPINSKELDSLEMKL